MRLPELNPMGPPQWASDGKKMKPVIASATSGLAWGFLGSYLTSEVAGTYSWYAAPAGIGIGLLIYWISRWTYRKPLWVIVPTAIISTVIAVALFGLCLGLVDLTRGIPNRIAWAVVVQGMNACLWGLLFIPLFWLLFLLAIGNHAVIRYMAKTHTEPAGAEPPALL